MGELQKGGEPVGIQFCIDFISFSWTVICWKETTDRQYSNRPSQNVFLFPLTYTITMRMYNYEKLYHLMGVGG